MPAPSLAREFYDRFLGSPDRAAFLRGLVNSNPPTYEGDGLDFKCQPNANLQDPQWRTMWIKALAGFANNQGGVLVWGIDARRDPATGIDAASGESPVDNPAAVKSRLIELQRGATDPPLANVEIEVVEVTRAPAATGFAVCYVPEGDFKPYRTVDGIGSQFFIRAGDSFTVMSRSVIQAMFYPRSAAVFRAHGELTYEIPNLFNPQARVIPSIANLSCKMQLVNSGTATAKDVLVRVAAHIESLGPPPIEYFSEEWVRHARSTGDVFTNREPMHPDRVAELRARWSTGAVHAAHGGRMVPNCGNPHFKLWIYCENQRPQLITVAFDRQEFFRNGRCECDATGEEAR
jgi:hypothetical protein